MYMINIYLKLLGNFSFLLTLFLCPLSPAFSMINEELSEVLRKGGVLVGPTAPGKTVLKEPTSPLKKREPRYTMASDSSDGERTYTLSLKLHELTARKKYLARSLEALEQRVTLEGVESPWEEVFRGMDKTYPLFSRNASHMRKAFSACAKLLESEEGTPAKMQKAFGTFFEEWVAHFNEMSKQKKRV